MDECCTLLGASMCLFIFLFEATNQEILPRGLVLQTTRVGFCMWLYTVQYPWCSLCCVGASFLTSMPCLFWYSFHCQCSRYISVHETKKKIVSAICKFLKLPNCVCFLRLSLCHLSCVVSCVGFFFFLFSGDVSLQWPPVYTFICFALHFKLSFVSQGTSLLTFIVTNCRLFRTQIYCSHCYVAWKILVINGQCVLLHLQDSLPAVSSTMGVV